MNTLETTTTTPTVVATEKAISLNDFIFNLAPEHSNNELFTLLDMEDMKYSEKSVRWYASKARAGIRR